METKKLYYEDCHLAAFSAQVVACEETPGGWLVELDRTAFYPEGGGQAADTGILGGVRVLHTSEDGERVLHLCDGPLSVGETVEGKIDYDLRFDRMQQHTGEHIVSGLIHSKYGWHNVGFHMGADVVTIDFDGEIPAEDLPELERRANEAVWKNLALKIWTPSPEELPNVFYRTKRALPWPVRIVQVPGYDSCACCGTHATHTGEVGLIKLLSCIRCRGGVRMEMVCGGRALAYMSRVYRQNLEVSHAFSAKVLETGEAARKMNDTLAALKFRCAELERQIFDSIAGQCAGKGDVLIFRDGLDPVGVRQLADRVAEVCGGTAAVLSGSDDSGYSYCLIRREGDLRAFNKAMVSALQGRGGGKPECQQGSLKSTEKEVREYFSSFFWLE